MAKKVGTDPFRRGNNTDKDLQPSFTEEIQQDLEQFMNLLSKDNNVFKPEKTYEFINGYVSKHKRILYSAISDYIFLILKDNRNDKRLDSIITNLDMLLKYSRDINWKTKVAECNQSLDPTSLVILKIWDHVNLAIKQFYSLWETEDEYDKRFSVRIQEFQNKIMSEMTGQLLTLVGIFTALAFLIFGSITSLESILDNLGNTSLLKVLTSGCIWGLCILNLLFVFLFCVKRLSKSDDNSKLKSRENVFQRYSIVCWSNFIIIALMLIFGWAYLIRQCGMDNWIIDIFDSYPVISFILGTVVLIIIVVFGAMFTLKHTSTNNSKPAKDKKKR